MSPPVLLLGLSPQGLFLLREYSKLGVQVFAVGRRNDVGVKSRYGQIFLLDHDEELPRILAEILDLANSDTRGIITSDYFLQLMLQHHATLLEERFRSMSNVDVLRVLANKQETYRVAREAGILVPTTCYLAEYESLEVTAFPMILKWNETPLARKLPFKAQLVNTYEDAKQAASRFSSIAPLLILQQIIPGTDLSYAGYFNNGDEVFACLTTPGRRVRGSPDPQQREQTPAGLSSYVSDYQGSGSAECSRAGRKLLKHLNANGFIEVEFRLHDSGQQYLLEVNPRIWGWAKFLKLKFLNFDELLLGTTDEPWTNPKPCKWFNELRDIMAVKEQCTSARSMRPLIEFACSYRGNKIFDIFEVRDPLPFFFQFIKG